MKSIPAHVIREIKERVDIVALIGDYVRLKRSGATYKGLCPFHNEKTPSFNVHPEKRIYHCFGCGAGGDIISFLRRVDGSGFFEVLERLAVMAGVDLSPYLDDDEGKIPVGRIYEALATAASMFIANLASSDEAMAYVRRRGLDERALAEFEIGFAADSWDHLYKALKKKKFTDDELAAAGLVRARRGSDGYYDYFRKRLIIPIRNDYGRIVAFGGRIVGEGEPKYLNSPETAVYSKGRVLFNLHRVAPGSVTVEEVILVEGYMDVVALHQAGFTNAIASLGTALTERQVRLLQKCVKRVLIGYDSDPAGMKATLRAIQALAETDLEVLVLNLPDGMDPDDVLREHGPEGIEAAVEKAVRVERHLCDTICRSEDVSTPHGRERALRRMFPLFSQLPTIVAKQNLIRIMSERLDLSEEVVRRSLLQKRAKERLDTRYGIGSGSGPAEARPPAPLDKRPARGRQRAERQLICCFLHEVSLFRERICELDIESFTDPFCRRMLQALSNRDDLPESGPVYEYFLEPGEGDDDTGTRLLTKEVLSSEITEHSAPRLVGEALRTLEKLDLEERKKELLQLIRSCGDFEEQRRYARELNDIARKLDALR